MSFLGLEPQGDSNAEDDVDGLGDPFSAALTVKTIVSLTLAM